MIVSEFSTEKKGESVTALMHPSTVAAIALFAERLIEA